MLDIIRENISVKSNIISYRSKNCGTLIVNSFM